MTRNDRQLQLAKHISHVQAGANRNYTPIVREQRTAKDRLTDFELPPKMVDVQRWLPSCPWAKRYVRIAATLGSMCPWTAYYDGRPAKSGLADEIIRQILPSRGTQRTLRQRSIGLQRQYGQHGVIIVQTVDGIRFDIAHSDQLIRSKADPENSFGVKLKPESKHGSSTWTEYPITRLKRLLVPDEEWPGQPWSALCDIATFMKMYGTLLEAAMSTVDQRRAVSNILHLKLDDKPESEHGTHDPVPKPGDETVDQEMEAITSIYDTWKRSYENGGVTRAMPDMFLWQGEVNMIDLGALLPAGTLDDLEKVARRGVDGLPISPIWLLDGTGAANHWGDAEQRRELHSQSIYPELQLNDQFWTETAFRPMMAMMLGEDTTTDVSKFELRSDTSVIEVKPDNTMQMLELYKAGIVSRECVIETTGQTPEKLLSIGDWSEIEFYLAANGVKTDAPGADTGDSVDPPEQAITATAGVLELL